MISAAALNLTLADCVRREYQRVAVCRQQPTTIMAFTFAFVCSRDRCVMETLEDCCRTCQVVLHPAGPNEDQERKQIGYILRACHVTISEHVRVIVFLAAYSSEKKSAQYFKSRWTLWGDRTFFRACYIIRLMLLHHMAQWPSWLNKLHSQLAWEERATAVLQSHFGKKKQNKNGRVFPHPQTAQPFCCCVFAYVLGK